MVFEGVYELGKRSPIGFSVKGIDARLKFVEYEYDSRAVVGASLTTLVAGMVLWMMAYMMDLEFLTLFFLFMGLVLSMTFFLYPYSIVYSQRLILYSEEMLKALMRISTFIQMNMSMEYAVVHTGRELRGTLKTQFHDIAEQLRLRKKNTLGAVFEQYIPIWNSVNPDFVKSLKLLETATLSLEEDKHTIIKEVLETLIIAYHTKGKRMAETLAANAKTLVAVGVLFPVISLMMLPLVSIFLPDIITGALLFFLYNILFPSLLLLMALNFSARRVQVDTIDLKESPFWTPTPGVLWIIGISIAVLLSIPTALHLMTINTHSVITVEREYQFESVLRVYSMMAGIVLGIVFFTAYYTHRYRRLWEDVDETERDLPHLLQTLATYLTLNLSMESIIPEIVDDYKKHGFGKHPVVKFFSILILQLKTSKKDLDELTRTVLPKIVPSRKVVNLLSSIMDFTKISSASAAQSAKMMREQTIALYQLDDYIKTLLAETVALVNITITFLAPILCAAAVLMSLAIVKSLTFISHVLVGIQEGFGSEAASLDLVDVTRIIPPTVVELIVGLYLIEMLLVLGLFSANVKVGSDTYQIAKTILNSMWGFVIYTIILLAGFYLSITLLFREVLGGAAG